MSGQSVQTAHLIRPIGRELVTLLRGLDAEAWQRPTSAADWSVKDVAAHLLDIDLRRVSIARDGTLPPPPDSPIENYGDLLRHLNSLNAEWVRAARRISPRALMDHLEISFNAAADVLEAADPDAEATYPVAWAGPTSSPMWLDVGREYTERWHHQDQIREAVGASPLGQREWLRPVLEISFQALPHAYRELREADGARICLYVTGESGGHWYLEHAGRWVLREGEVTDCAAVVRVRDLDLARLLLHRLSGDSARRVLHIDGRQDLVEPLIAARAVMV